MNYTQWSFANTGEAKIAEMRYNIIRLHNQHHWPKYKEYANVSLLALDLFDQSTNTSEDPRLIKLFDLILQLEGSEEAYAGEPAEAFYKNMVELSCRLQSKLEEFSDHSSVTQESLLERLEQALIYHNISAQKVRTKSVMGFSVTNRPFYDVMILEGNLGTKERSSAMYCSEPIDIKGKYLLPFYILATTLNINSGIPGCWQFVISNGKGYFYYKYEFGDSLVLEGFSDTQLAVHLSTFANYVRSKMPNDLLSIRRFIMMTDRDMGLGHSMYFSKALTDNASFEDDLPAEERERLLALQVKYEADPDLTLSPEDEDALADLYMSQLVSIRDERIECEIKIHGHFASIIRKLDQIAHP